MLQQYIQYKSRALAWPAQREYAIALRNASATLAQRASYAGKGEYSAAKGHAAGKGDAPWTTVGRGGQGRGAPSGPDRWAGDRGEPAERRVQQRGGGRGGW